MILTLNAPTLGFVYVPLPLPAESSSIFATETGTLTVVAPHMISWPFSLNLVTAFDLTLNVTLPLSVRGSMSP